MAVYAAWMTLLVVAYYALPGLRVVVWGVLVLSGVAGIVAGVILNRPAQRAPWMLLAAANLSFAVGQLSFLFLTQIRHQAVPFPSLVGSFLPDHLPPVRGRAGDLHPAPVRRD